MYSSSFRVFAITLIFGSLSFALPYAADNAKANNSVRSVESCADPTLAQTIFQSFLPGASFHVLNFLHFYENTNTISNEIAFGDLHPVFRAWPTQQDLLVPLFQLTSGGEDAIYRIGADLADPPVVSGFTGARVIAWVYRAQVCSSVPLLSAAQTASTDHYFTSIAFDHDSLIGDGWVDDGAVAFVLPLQNS